jgi:hypothetical protein
MYNPKVIEIADYMFKYPEKKTADITSIYCEKFHRSRRTIDTCIKKAKEYNAERLQKQEIIKENILLTQTKKVAKKAILTRQKCLSILSDIAMGKSMEQQITINDRIRAIQQISKMENWELDKTEINTNEQITSLKIEIIK